MVMPWASFSKGWRFLSLSGQPVPIRFFSFYLIGISLLILSLCSSQKVCVCRVPPTYYLAVRLKAKVSFPTPQIFSSSLKKVNYSTITSFIVYYRSLIIMVRLHLRCLQDSLGKTPSKISNMRGTD